MSTEKENTKKKSKRKSKEKEVKSCEIDFDLGKKKNMFYMQKNNVV